MKITAKQYARVLYDLTAGKSEEGVDSTVKKLVEELRKSGQLKLASKIIEEFNAVWNEQNGIIEAEVVSARELNKDVLESVKKFVEKKYWAREVALKSKIKKDLKGGIIIRVGDEVLDGSIIERLRKLKIELLKA